MVRALVVLLLVGLVAFVAGAAYLLHDPVTLDEPIRVLIPPGHGTGQIAAALQNAGLLRFRPLFVGWAKLRGVDRQLQPGLYEFTGQVSILDILETLRTRRAVTVRITLPEGWTVADMSLHLGAKLGFDTHAIANLARDTSVLRKWSIPFTYAEGYLLPETYEFYWGVTPAEVIDRLIGENHALRADSVNTRLSQLDMTWHEVLTLASMIEAETADGAERARISGVFHNRLKRRMLLQCDPTVIYAMGGLPPGRRLWRKDLEFESPYNTYLHGGLPPGPICNPGEAAIMAALYPAPTRELYFVADGRGGHVFSRTLAEHNRAVARAKRERRKR